MKLIAHNICGRVFKHPNGKDGLVLSSLHGLAIQPIPKMKINRYKYDGYAYSSPFKDVFCDVHVNNFLPGETLCLENDIDQLFQKELVSNLSIDQKYAIYSACPKTLNHLNTVTFTPI